jgi:G3E family GTPase
MATTQRPALLVVAGGTTPAAAAGTERVIGHLRTQRTGTAVVHHDLREVAQGVVHRRMRFGRTDDAEVLELAHGCASCTLREDVLPLLAGLARTSGVAQIVLQLDPVLEPEQVCWAVLHVLVDGVIVADLVDLRGVISVVDVETWLDDATCDDDVAERGLALLPGDERTLAQLVVGQAEFADLLVYAGENESWRQARADAVLDRLVPLAVRLRLDQLDRTLLLDDLPDGARRGRPDNPHAPLLHGQPTLAADLGVRLVVFSARRPFHPERLHRALDALLVGVVRARGRIWLATRPDSVLWIESAGGGLRIGHVGDWLTAGGDDDWDRAHPERRAAAALRWHPRWGDRAQEIAVLIHDADPTDIEAALHGALLDDDELAAGEAAWHTYPDPFGWWHTEPCDDIATEPARNGPAHDRSTPDQEEKN